MGELKHFANASHDSRHWTPEQCLEAALADLHSGELATAANGKVGKVTQLSVHFYIEGDDGRLRLCHYIAGMNTSEYIALLSVSLQTAIEDWRS